MKNLNDAAVAIVGCGLMGGSLALGLHAQAVCRRLLVVTREAETRQELLARGIVDAAGEDLSLVSDADIIVLATPVRTILAQLPSVAGFAHDDAVILDLGSTKREVVAAMEHLPSHVQPIGGHPMCGKEIAGFGGADASLYQNALFILSPLSGTSVAALESTRSLVRAIGARPLLLDAERHDKAVAASSHLPFALAVALTATAAEQTHADDLVWRLAASGFRDTSRLAASDTTMMMDILMTNRKNVVELMRSCTLYLDRVADQIERGDEASLEQVLGEVAALRRTLAAEYL